MNKESTTKEFILKGLACVVITVAIIYVFVFVCNVLFPDGLRPAVVEAGKEVKSIIKEINDGE